MARGGPIVTGRGSREMKRSAAVGRAAKRRAYLEQNVRKRKDLEKMSKFTTSSLMLSVRERGEQK